MFLRLQKVLFLVLTLSVFATPAFALTRGQTRELQEKLILLGYEPGPIDGAYGRQTRAAVRKFQKDAEIRVDGVVGRQTLGALDEFVARGNAAGQKPQAANIQLDIYEDVLTDRLMSGSVTLPSRFAKVELTRAGAGRYTLAINGNVVATSPGGNGLPRISHTFEMPGEDAYVFASMAGRRQGCRLEHTLVVVRQDGSFMPPTPVGNCQEILNARVQDNTFVMSFPPEHVPSWRLEESWVYYNGQIERK